MEPRPAHLGPRYAAMFLGEDVARAYAARPPYPPAAFEWLGGLCDPGCRVVLDAGAGTGDLARPLAAIVDRVDAVDPSRAMVDAGRARAGGGAETLRWIVGTAEAAPLDGPYGLVTAGQSLCWMEWDVVFARWKRAMSARAVVAIVERTVDVAPWARALGALVARYSTNRAYRPYDLLAELDARRLFAVEGTHRIDAETTATVDEVLTHWHSRNGLAVHAMREATAAAFDAEARAVLAPFADGGLLRVPAGAEITWGRPR